ALPAVGHPPPAPAGPRRIPHRTLGVHADAVGRVVAQVGEDPPPGQAAVAADVEGGQPPAVRLGDDQGGVVGGDGHAVGEGQVLGDPPDGAVGGGQHDVPRRRRLAGHHVEADAVDIGVAAAVDHDVVPALPARVGV